MIYVCDSAATTGMAPKKRSELIHFLSRNDFLIRGRTQAGVELTHTLMDGNGGGRICLPDHAMDGFMAAYGSDLRNNINLYVIERRTPVFKMHFDLDLKIMHDDATTKSILNFIQEEVSKFITPGLDRETWCVACAIIGKDMERKGLGLHIVFPWLLVDTNQALWIRASVVCCLRQQFYEIETDWETIVDVAVLTSNGFRMVGSDKCRDCQTCHNSRDARPFCADCCCQGRLPEGKIYWPWETFPMSQTHTLREELAGNQSHAVQMCSTRVPQSRQVVTPRFVIPVGAPPPSMLKKIPAANAKIHDKQYQLCESKSGNLRLRTEAVTITPEIRTALHETLAHHNAKYATLELVSLDRLLGVRHRASFSLKVRGFGCRYCQNKQDEHTRQTVYFIISRDGISQRCYSRKSIQRHFGLCEKYASPSTCLLPSLICQLYPDALNIPIQNQKHKRNEEVRHEAKRSRTGISIAEELWGVGKKQ